MRFYLKRRTADVSKSKLRGFTVLELIVAVSVTAVLSGMLLLISRQVLETQSVSSAELERNQIAHFVLDQIQEDLQCALYRNDGNVWMAMSLLNQSDNSGSWIEPKKSSLAKPPLNSLRIIESDWPSDALQDAEIDSLGQGPFAKSRFGLAGTWLRFFTQSPELDPQAKGDGAARAVSCCYRTLLPAASVCSQDRPMCSQSHRTSSRWLPSPAHSDLAPSSLR